MSESRVAARYARAIFGSAQKQNIIPSIEDDLNGVCAAIEGNPDLRAFLGNPRIGREDRLKMYDKLFSDRVTGLTMSLLRLLVSKNRESEIDAIRDVFIRLRQESGQVVPVTVESAQELDAAQRQSILDKVAKATGRTPEPTFVVRPEIIGGVRVTYDNLVIDGSLRGGLDRLRERIVKDLLNQA